MNLAMLSSILGYGVTVAQRTLNPQPSEGVSVGSNPTTPTIMEEKLWKELFRAHIDAAKAIDRLVREYDMENSQEYLNWQDELNEISVR